MPIRFSHIEGWENRDTCKHFADFSYFISKQYGDLFKKIATINEPWCVSWLSHYLGEHAPGKKNIKSATTTMHNILLAHGWSVEALRVNKSHEIGIVLNNQYAEPLDQQDENKIPIYITENGMANNDKLDSNGEVNDSDRIEFFNLHLREILNCINEGLSVKGYFAWSLLDNYEWAFGYSKRFGLVYVDFDSYKRVPKKSYYEFSKNLFQV